MSEISTTKQPTVSDHDWVELAQRFGLLRHQVEVAQCLLAGKADPQICLILRLSASAVRAHRQLLFAKLEAADGVEFRRRLAEFTSQRRNKSLSDTEESISLPLSLE